MDRAQGAESIKELTAWLEADDAKSRAIRAKRLRDLLDILPVPLEGLSFLGGESSRICFDEVRRCYLDGSYMAVVLLCLAYVERELAADLYAAGWENAKKAPLATVLERAYGYGALSDLELRTYRELAHLRNSHAHFRAPGDETPGNRVWMGSRADGSGRPREPSRHRGAREGRKGRAIQEMARLVKRQSGMRVALGSPEE